jgi:hypothetical protein
MTMRWLRPVTRLRSVSQRSDPNRWPHQPHRDGFGSGVGVRLGVFVGCVTDSRADFEIAEGVRDRHARAGSAEGDQASLAGRTPVGAEQMADELDADTQAVTDEKCRQSPTIITFEPFVVVEAIVLHSTFGRPRNPPSRLVICGGSAELVPTKRYVVSQMVDEAAKVALPWKPPRDPNDELTDRLHAELSGRIKNAHGDVKRLNAVMREYFDGMDLLHRDGGRVEVRPVLRPAQLQRFLDQGDFPGGRHGI